MKINSQLLGAAGVHFVAARLNALGLHAAPTIRNAPGVDLLVSDREGTRSASVQVKTTNWAARDSGRGESKSLSRYEWASKYVETSSKSLFYAFVDLKDFTELPDIYFLPSQVVAKWYSDRGPRAGWKWPRFHPASAFMDPYRNNFTKLCRILDAKDK
jgi:hypothetical protein